MIALTESRGRPYTNPDAVCHSCGATFHVWKQSNVNRFCSRACVDQSLRRAPDFIAKARAHWVAGMTFVEIGQTLGVSRNVIAGIAYRYDFPARAVGFRQAAE